MISGSALTAVLIQNPSWRCLLVEMKNGSLPAPWLWLVPCLLAAVAAVLTANRSQFSAAPRSREVDNNPDKFHLVATNSAYDVHFTYDPLAADHWLFQRGVPVNTVLLLNAHSEPTLKPDHHER